MKLISSPASPFVRKVRVVLHETDQIGDVEEIPVATTALNTAPEARAANPTGKIPALILDDGSTIYDSRVITRFLDDRAKAGLYPDDRIWPVLTLEATADGLTEAAVLMVYEARLRPEAQQSSDWVEAQWGKVTGALDALETTWLSYLTGPLNIGQIAVACGLGYLDFRHGARGWRAEYPELAAWYESFSKRPSMVATLPAG